MDWISEFFFLYPIVMSIVWIIGGCYFYYRYERKSPVYPDLQEFPLVSILVPAHNEEEHIVETVTSLLHLEYPNYEIIVIDDGSTDATQPIIEQLAMEHEKVRNLILKNNMGKAAALNHGLLFSRGDILVTIDADCKLDPKALHWLAWHFVKHPRVGAVTGNPRVRNRSTLLSKIQAAEYSSIIGLIKRTQRFLGKVLTVSGVIAAFRKQAILDCKLWDTDMVTEDINITWKLEKHFWAVHYELNAIGWILVPETIRGLLKQRIRWAQGGCEVLLRHKDIWLSWKQRRLWPIYVDYVLSIIWAVSLPILTILWVINTVFALSIPEWLQLNPIPQWTGSMIALICLIQFIISISLDSKYDKSLYQHYLWVIWYPVVYWAFSACAVIFAVPKALTKKLGTTATWKSPDRGIQSAETEAAATVSGELQQGPDIIINVPKLVPLKQKVTEGIITTLGSILLSIFLILLTLAIWFYIGNYFYNNLLVPAYTGDMSLTIEVLFRLSLLGLAVFILLFLWAEYNRRTYAHLTRRRFAPPSNLDVVAAFFNTTTEKVIMMQNFKVASLERFDHSLLVYECRISSLIPSDENPDDIKPPLN